MGFWVYKCNNSESDHKVYAGDWSVFFDSPDEFSDWGSTEVVPKLRQLVPGDMVVAYQTNRNALVGLAKVHDMVDVGDGELEVVLEPVQRWSEIKVKPFRSNPDFAAIRAFAPGFPRTLYALREDEYRTLLRFIEFALTPSVAARRRSRDLRETVLQDDGDQGFSTDSERRRLIEREGQRFVDRHFAMKGWKVSDVSGVQCGWDLTCTKDGRELHVEAKASTGREPSFFITDKEKRTWDADPNYVLAFVGSVFTTPEMHEFTWKDRTRFRFQAVQHKATLA
jgi:hypothetical protein